MTHNVEYQVSLKDLLSGAVKKAEGNVNHFEKTLEHTGETAKEMLGMAAGFLGTFAIAEFFKSSVEAFNEAERPISQIKAAIESTHGAAGLMFEELIEDVEKFKLSTIYDDDQVADMQAQLLSFPEITKKVFGEAEQAVMDLATRTHKGLNEVSVMVGKALSDPAQGVAALHRVGVEFSDSQIEVIKHLQETNQLAAAQRIVLSELAREYGGSTAAASETAAGQMEILKHQFNDVKQSIGRLVMEQAVHLAPMLKSLIEDFRHLVDWVEKNSEGIIEGVKVIGGITAAVWAFGKTKAAVIGVAEAWGTLKTAVIAGAEAMAGANAAAAVTAEVAATSAASTATASVGGIAVAAEATGEGIAAALFANPVGIAIVASAATLVGIYGLTEIIAHKNKETEEKNAQNAANEKFNTRAGKGIRDLSGETMQQMPVGEFFSRRQNEMSGSQYQDVLEQHMASGTKEYQATMLTHSKEMFSDLVNASQKDIKLVTTDAKDKLYAPILDFIDAEYSKFKMQDSHKKGVLDASGKLEATQNKVQGQSTKNTYVTINGGLIHDFTIKTTNLKEATPDVKRIVTQTLTDAINDSEINN